VPSNLIQKLDASIRRDPARRGLIGTEPIFGPLCPGHLAQAAAHLAEFGRRVVIVTGFYIPAGDPPAAETDGPPGALVLAQTLLGLGIDARILTDSFCFSAVVAAAKCCGFPAERLVQSRPSVVSDPRDVVSDAQDTVADSPDAAACPPPRPRPPDMN